MTKQEYANMLKLIKLCDEFCAAIDLAEADIGGGRAPKDILKELGPATDNLTHLLQTNRRGR